MASRRSESGISRTITGRCSPPAASVWVTPSASRKGRERKKSSLAAPAPPSGRSSALTVVREAGEVLGQQSPDLIVDPLVAADDRLALQALLTEAQEGDHLLGRLVCRRDLGVDAMGPELAEGVDARLALGLPGHALPPRLGLADQDRELGTDVAAEPEEGDEANGRAGAVDRDRPLAVARGVHGALDPPLRVIRGELVPGAHEVRGHAPVVEPAMDGVRVLGTEVAQRHLGGHRRVILGRTPRGHAPNVPQWSL